MTACSLLHHAASSGHQLELAPIDDLMKQHDGAGYMQSAVEYAKF